MKLQRLMIDFAPDARPMPRHLAFLDTHLLPAALATAALFFIAWLLRE